MDGDLWTALLTIVIQQTRCWLARGARDSLESEARKMNSESYGRLCCLHDTSGARPRRQYCNSKRFGSKRSSVLADRPVCRYAASGARMAILWYVVYLNASGRGSYDNIVFAFFFAPEGFLLPLRGTGTNWDPFLASAALAFGSYLWTVLLVLVIQNIRRYPN